MANANQQLAALEVVYLADRMQVIRSRQRDSMVTLVGERPGDNCVTYLVFRLSEMGVFIWEQDYLPGGFLDGKGVPPAKTMAEMATILDEFVGRWRKYEKRGS